MKTYNYRTKGACAVQINVTIGDDGKIENVEFLGGCDGNHKGIVSLVKGMDVDTVIDKLEGITCGPRRTSCPDQLAQALKAIRAQKQEG